MKKSMLPLLMFASMFGAESPFDFMERKNPDMKLDRILNDRELLLNEYSLIQEKRSNFTANDRELIKRKAEEILKETNNG